MKRTTRAFLAIAAVGALTLSGCASGGSSQSGANNGAAGGGEVAMPELSDINEQDRGALEEGGNLRLPISDMPTNYNTLNVNGNTVDQGSTLAMFVEPTNWIYNEDGSFEINPNFVTAYDSREEDGKQVTNLNLNPDAVWGDGTPITVADYIATWQACNGEAEGYNCASTDGFADMESVEQGVDEFDVVIKFKATYPDWSAPLSTVWPAAGFKDAATFNDGWDTPNNDWFAGPFQWGNIDTAQQVITLERNPNWWGEEALLDTVTLRAADPAATATAFANGELDVLSGIIDGAEYAQAAGRSDAEIRRAGGLQWRHFTFNGQAGVLADREVRVALTKGINREAITVADLAGIPDINPAELLLGNHFFMPGQVGYEDNSAVSAYDPEQAGKDLDAAGWKLEDGAEYRTKDGEILEFEYVMMPDVSTSKTEGELLQQQMADIGVKVNIVNVSTAAFFDEYVIPGNFQTAAFAWQGTPYPLNNVGQLYSCDSIENGSNFTQTCVPEIDELIPQIAAEVDPEKRNELGNQADKLIWDNVMFFPIYRRLEMTAVDSNLANYGAFGMASVQAENIGWAK